MPERESAAAAAESRPADPDSAPVPGTAAAKAQAVALFHESEALYRAGELEAAAELLFTAYALDPDPTLLYNLARVEEGLGRPEAAARHYREFLLEEPAAPDRGAIEKRIATLEAQLAARAGPRAAGTDAAAPATPHDATAARRPAWPVLVVAGGIGVLAGGGVLGVLAREAHRDAEREEGFAAAVAAQDRAEARARAANVLFVVGGGVVTLGAVATLVVPRSRARAGSAAVRVRVGAAATGSMLAVAPLISAPAAAKTIR